MRRIIPCVLALPILLAAGCGSPEQEVSPDSPTVDESATDAASEPQDPPEETEEGDEEDTVDGGGTGGEFAFGEGAAFPHPVGAYEEEFQEGVTEDVVYTVDDVVLTAPGQVGFTLTVEVPELGRVFGTGLLDVRCSYGEHAEPATTDAPLGELEAGTHTTDMVCDAPESPDSVLVSVANGGDEADFRGPVG
ncbi:hypothetical protein [Nocardiopsis ganjiahuensis]|uniref:hypothetical protein n=1 Tax=Nocardiopsis ganjiahuensis TaxID=239984 RepID=UPI00034D659C|nr:hypothetical protein [Nocardiopsis ganjiahuensis]